MDFREMRRKRQHLSQAESISILFSNSIIKKSMMDIKEFIQSYRKAFGSKAPLPLLFIGLFDPSVRPYIGTNELSFTIPFSRFTRMTGTMKECFLFDSHAWKKVKARLEE